MRTRPDLQSSFFKNEKLACGLSEVYYRFNLNVNDEPDFYKFVKNLDTKIYLDKVKVTPILPYKTHAKIEFNDFYCYVTCHSSCINYAIRAMVYCGII